MYTSSNQPIGQSPGGPQPYGGGAPVPHQQQQGGPPSHAPQHQQVSLSYRIVLVVVVVVVIAAAAAVVAAVAAAVIIEVVVIVVEVEPVPHHLQQGEVGPPSHPPLHQQVRPCPLLEHCFSLNRFQLTARN